MSQKGKVCPTLGTKKCHCSSREKFLDTPRCEDIHALFRALWSNHAWYTVQFIENALFPCLNMLKEVQKELMDNQIEIGYELGRLLFKNAQKGQRMGELLQEHIKAAAAATTAAKTASKDVKQKIQDLYDQGDVLASTLADFLGTSKATELQQEFHTHNEHVVNLVTLLLKKNTSQFLKELSEYICHMHFLSDQIVNLST